MASKQKSEHSLKPFVSVKCVPQQFVPYYRLGMHNGVQTTANKQSCNVDVCHTPIPTFGRMYPHSLGQVVALRAHCVHTAYAEAGILTQEYLSPDWLQSEAAKPT